VHQKRKRLIRLSSGRDKSGAGQERGRNPQDCGRGQEAHPGGGRVPPRGLRNLMPSGVLTSEKTATLTLLASAYLGDFINIMLLSKHASIRLILSLKGPSHIVNPLPVCSQQLGAETIFNRFLTYLAFVFHLVKYWHIYNYITLKVFSILKYVIIFKDEFICAIKHFSLSCLIFLHKCSKIFIFLFYPLHYDHLHERFLGAFL
jgi:hypothetical protein